MLADALMNLLSIMVFMDTRVRSSVGHKRMAIHPSELKLEGHLHGAWTADLVERTEASQLIVQHVGRLSKIRCRQCSLDGSKVRMIEDIKSLCAELKMHLLRQVELSPERKVYLPRPQPTDNVAPEIPELTCRWRAKWTFSCS